MTSITLKNSKFMEGFNKVAIGGLKVAKNAVDFLIKNEKVRKVALPIVVGCACIAAGAHIAQGGTIEGAAGMVRGVVAMALGTTGLVATSVGLSNMIEKLEASQNSKG